jgi:hypothetical protein
MIFLIFIILLCYEIFLWGVVCWKFWLWFVLPIFPELPTISFVHAVGLSLFISLFKNHSTQFVKNQYVDNDTTILQILVSPLLTFVIGWLTYIIFLK